MKIITSVTIDSELLKEAKRKGISLSKVLDKALRKKLNFSDKVREEIDKFCKELKLSNKVKKKALRIYNKTIKDSKKARKIKNVHKCFDRHVEYNKNIYFYQLKMEIT